MARNNLPGKYLDPQAGKLPVVTTQAIMHHFLDGILLIGILFMKNIAYLFESKPQYSPEEISDDVPARYGHQTSRDHFRTGYGDCKYGIDLSGTLDNALLIIRHCINNGISPVYCAGAISAANGGLGNRNFMQHVQGLAQQRKPTDTHRVADNALRGAGRPLTHLDAIQESFGHHDVTGMREITGSSARQALTSLRAEGFTGNGRMAVSADPDLFTQAHEAAHGVQQAALGNDLGLKDGIGEAGDKYERHADAVAEKVLRGQSAQALLDDMAGGIQTTVEATNHTGAVQFNEEITDKFKSGKSRLILLDYDGTLVGFHEDPMKAVPDDELHDIIERLTRYENTKVVINTGRSRDEIFKFLGGHEKLEFVAEHGMWRKKTGDKDWVPTMELDLSWKEEVKPIFQRYVTIMPNSYIEEKVYSLGWQYRPVQDTEAAEQAGKQLEAELKEYFRQTGKEKEWLVTHNNMVVEINTAGADKGTSATVIAGEADYDFILALGDGSTDEFMFRALPNHQTVKVGTGKTSARHTVKDVTAVRNLLKHLVV